MQIWKPFHVIIDEAEAFFALITETFLSDTGCGRGCVGDMEFFWGRQTPDEKRPGQQDNSMYSDKDESV